MGYLNKRVSEAWRKTKATHGVTQNGLAKMLGITQPMVRKLLGLGTAPVTFQGVTKVSHQLQWDLVEVIPEVKPYFLELQDLLNKGSYTEAALVMLKIQELGYVKG